MHPLYPHTYVCMLAFLGLFTVAYYCVVFYRTALCFLDKHVGQYSVFARPIL